MCIYIDMKKVRFAQTLLGSKCITFLLLFSNQINILIFSYLAALTTALLRREIMIHQWRKCTGTTQQIPEQKEKERRDM